VTPDEAQAVVRAVEAGWPQRAMSRETAVLYADGLMDLPLDVVKSAVRRLVRCEEYRPAVAVVRREVLVLMGQLPPSLDEALGQAQRWYEWRSQAGWANGTGYNSVRPDLDNVVVRVCESLNVDINDHTWRHLFRAAYKDATDEVVRTLLVEGPK
jgi:hypothetical protein